MAGAATTTGTPKARTPLPASGTTDARVPLAERDGVWMAAVAAVAAVLYAFTFSGAVAGGDAPESVAGVESVGILHAPGYPAYVLAARAFSWLIPFGDLAFRVNLFSAACATGAVVALFALGRACRLPRPVAAFGALVLATGSSFWFYATFAKFYPLTSLLLISAAVLVLRWAQDGRWWRILTAAAFLGVATGASYQVVVLVVPGLVLAVALSQRRERWAALGAAAGVAGAVSAALWGFVYVRAGQDPALNWGGASTTDRLVDLVSMRDFGWGSAAFSSVGGQSARLSVTDLGSVPEQIGRYAVLFSLELSAVLVVLAAVGAWRSRRVLPRPAAWMLWAVFAVNLLGAMVAVGIGGVSGFGTGLRFGGFLLAATFVAALWSGIGAWAALDALAGLARRRAQHGPRRARNERRARVDRAVPVLGGVGAAFLLVPQVVVHGAVAEQPGPIVSNYARDVFQTVEDDALLLVWTPDDAFPLDYGQVVEGYGDGVEIVTLGALPAPWYRDQVEERLGVEVTEWNDPREAALELVELLPNRPVYLEHRAWARLSETVRTRPSGLVAEVLPGEPEILPVDIASQQRLLDETYDDAALRSFGYEWPYEPFAEAYATAHLGLARALADEGRVDDVRRELETILELRPGDRVALDALERLDQVEG